MYYSGPAALQLGPSNLKLDIQLVVMEAATRIFPRGTDDEQP
jgi:hypothetical protein